MKIEYAVCIMWRVRLISALRGGLHAREHRICGQEAHEGMPAVGEGSWVEGERAGEWKRWKERAWEEERLIFRGGVFFTGDSGMSEPYVHVHVVIVTICFFVTRVSKLLLCALCAPETRLGSAKKGDIVRLDKCKCDGIGQLSRRQARRQGISLEGDSGRSARLLFGRR